MEKYKNLYLWLIIPFLITQLSIFKYYWLQITDQAFSIHIHYWAVTSWYLLLIIQPYLITKGKIVSHRTLGIIGFVIAGGVLFTGISTSEISMERVNNYDASKVGIPVAFYYGTLLIGWLSMLAFAFAIVKSILHRRQLLDHSWWLIASLFYMMMPALGRGMINLAKMTIPKEYLSPMLPLIGAELVYVSLFILFAIKFGKVKHLATLIGLLLVVIRFLRFPIGSIESLQNFFHQMIK